MYRTKSYRTGPDRTAPYQTVLYHTMYTCLLTVGMKVPGVEPSPDDFLTLLSPEKLHKIKKPLQTKSPLVWKPEVEGQDAR